MLVLPQWVAVLPSGREHVLRECTGCTEPGACDLRLEPLRGGNADGHGTGAGGTRCTDGGPKRGWNADGTGGELLHRTEHGHHENDGDGADGPTDGDPHSGAMGRSDGIFREGSGPGIVGLRARNVASLLDVQNGTIFEARIVIGGVAARPLRLRRVENAIAGRPINEETLEEAGRLAVQNARPLQFNAYKIALTRNLVKRAIRDAIA